MHDFAEFWDGPLAMYLTTDGVRGVVRHTAALIKVLHIVPDKAKEERGVNAHTF